MGRFSVYPAWMPKVEIVVPWDAPADVETVVDRLRDMELASKFDYTRSSQVSRIKFECDDPSSIGAKLGIVGTGLTINVLPE